MHTDMEADEVQITFLSIQKMWFYKLSHIFLEQLY